MNSILPMKLDFAPVNGNLLPAQTEEEKEGKEKPKEEITSSGLLTRLVL